MWLFMILYESVDLCIFAQYVLVWSQNRISHSFFYNPNVENHSIFAERFPPDITVAEYLKKTPCLLGNIVDMDMGMIYNWSKS